MPLCGDDPAGSHAGNLQSFRGGTDNENICCIDIIDVSDRALRFRVIIKLVGFIEHRATAGLAEIFHEPGKRVAGCCHAGWVARIALDQEHAGRIATRFQIIIFGCRPKFVRSVAGNQLDILPQPFEHIVIRCVFGFLDRDTNILFHECENGKDAGTAAGKDGDVICCYACRIVFVVVICDRLAQFDFAGRLRVLEIGGGNLDVLR